MTAWRCHSAYDSSVLSLPAPAPVPGPRHAPTSPTTTMGHSSSKEQQPQPQPQLQSQGRHTYKLSKPRITNSISPPSAQPTGAPSTAPLTTSRIPPARPVRSPDPAPDLLISIPYSATASSSIESPEDDRKESQPIPDRSSSFRSPPKPQRRLSLFRSKSSQERADLHKSRRNTIIGTPVVSPEEGFVAASGAVGRTHSLSTYHPAHELHVEAGLSVTLKFVSTSSQYYHDHTS